MDDASGEAGPVSIGYNDETDKPAGQTQLLNCDNWPAWSRNIAARYLSWLERRADNTEVLGSTPCGP